MTSLSATPDAGVASRTLPLLAAQPGIWFGEQAAPDANAYSVAHSNCSFTQPTCRIVAVRYRFSDNLGGGIPFWSASSPTGANQFLPASDSVTRR